MLEKIRQNIFALMETDDLVMARVIDIFLLVLILLNVIMVVLESVSSLTDRFAIFFLRIRGVFCCRLYGGVLTAAVGLHDTRGILRDRQRATAVRHYADGAGRFDRDCSVLPAAVVHLRFSHAAASPTFQADAFAQGAEILRVSVRFQRRVQNEEERADDVFLGDSVSAGYRVGAHF